ncbi:MAG: hypothetical protein Q8L92_03340, partial [Rubrivivax sp.]|nr:hypothetical protein [Rubrivivax sp.]
MQNARSLPKTWRESGVVNDVYGYDTMGRVAAATSRVVERRITNPRGFASTHRFQAFDVPSEDAPAALFGPEQLNLAIVRDAYGKPRSVNR